ncbi:hypothetical protein [Pseudodesulfovibrio sp.]|uniref:hypothetical protein n=1 Tax=Pseudodesulfovibrio sp. TaxID=2035812 RepID=UPI00262DE447|nr:hypothetical protein [Pseudodesulfovibrio sp.]MDD3312120.1 hypothetical protein [Pseudodesulfovibrio sp.]
MRNTLPKQTVTVYPDGTSHPASWVGDDKATRGKQVEMVPTYLVPDLKRHLFLRWNNEMMTPVSPATWLTEAPFILPGENAVSVPPGKPVAGAIAFLVPDETLRQMSLHFYDTNYGHAEIPLVGALPEGVERLSGLPAKPPVRLSDTFSLAIREVADVKAVGGQEAGGGCVYRIVDADLVSNVQALLDLNPAERFSLRLNTTEGALSVRLHNVTGMLPLGFLAPTMLSPGSSNRVRLAFRVPEKMAAEAGKGELVVDVKGGGVVIPLDGKAAGAPVAQVPPDAVRGDGVRLAVNALKRLDGEGDVFVADLTLFDDKDGQSTSMTNAFILKKKHFVADPGYQAPPPDYGKSKGLAGFATGNAIIPAGTMPPDSITDDLIFGITDDTVIPDGGSLRGLVVFKLPYGDAEPGDWLLTSPLFPDLKRELGAGRYGEERLMARRSDVAYQVNATYLDGLADAVARLTRRREAQGFKRPGETKVNRQTLDGEQPPSRSVPAPDLTAPATDQFAAIKDLKGLKARVAKLRYLPTDGAGWGHLFAPQAVLTQNWGGEGDIAVMAERVLARQGVTTRRVTVDVTDKGRAALAALAGVDQANLSALPALLYHDPKGNRHVLVAPFLETAAKLPGLVGSIRDREVSPAETQATVTAYLLARPKNGGQGKAARDLSDAFSGETNTDGVEPVCLLTANPTLPELSRGAVDLGYTVVGYGNGAVVKAVFDGNDKRVIGADAIDTGDYEVVGERIVIDMPGGQLTFERDLEEGESIVDRFHTLGLNLPDMNAAAARKLTKAMQAAHKGETSPDNLSALKWYSRSLLYRFVAAQTEYETDLAARMGLVVGRSARPRCLIATVSRSGQDGAVRTAIDLRRTANQVHPSAGFSDQAAHGFNIMSGLFASKLEADVLPGGGTGFFEMLAAYPADTEFLWLTADARYNMEDQLKAAAPERVLKLLDNGRTVLFPSQPAIIDGRPRWSWLEVNPETYETIAVLDTGARGSMVERVFSDLWRDGLDYITGGLVGVSSSIWSVSAFSLVLDDYKQILAEAKKFALGLADNFTASVKVGDFEFKGKVGGSTIETGYSGSGAGAVNAAKTAKGAWGKLNDPKIDLGGFEGGFKDGVNAYFAAAGG